MGQFFLVNGRQSYDRTRLLDVSVLGPESHQCHALLDGGESEYFVYNSLQMTKQNLTLIAIALTLSGCNKSPAPVARASNSASTPAPAAMSAPATPANDSVQQKLKEIAGSGALDCGRHEIQAPNDELKTASACVMDAAKVKKPFYVGYDMPGMTNAIAGDAKGKLFAVQLQGSGTGAQMASGACPGELRVASSGRVTCFVPGSMSLGSTGGDPHAGMALNPTAGASPHSGLGIPAPMAPPPPKSK
jgi:hypothetical protein